MGFLILDSQASFCKMRVSLILLNASAVREKPVESFYTLCFPLVQDGTRIDWFGKSMYDQILSSPPLQAITEKIFWFLHLAILNRTRLKLNIIIDRSRQFSIGKKVIVRAFSK